MRSIKGGGIQLRRASVAGVAAAVLLAACGDSTVSNNTPEAAAAATNPSSPPVGAPAAGAPPMGSAPPMDPGASAPPVSLPPIGESLAPLPPQVVRGYWNGVAQADSAKRLAKASLLFSGRNPTATEADAVARGGDAAVRTTVATYLNGPAFDRFLEESAMSVFLTNRVNTRGGDRGLSNADFPMLANLGGQAAAFDTALRREPIEFVKFVVKGNRPWTDVVQGNYTVVNPVLAQFLGAQLMNGEAFADPANMNEWRMAQIPMREHAGVVSTHAWLDSFPTTPTNRNRHRVNMMAKQFLATDVTALAARPIEDGTRFNVPVMDNPGCAICHDVIDPIAAGWQNWAENNRFRPSMVNEGRTALPASYRANNYPKKTDGSAWYMAGDNWFRDGRAPGYATVAMPGGYVGSPTALQWLGQRVASDARFALGGVHFWYQAVFGRAPLRAPTDPTSPQYQNQRLAYEAQKAELDRIAGIFASAQFNVRTLLIELVLSPLFGAERVAGKNPAELADLGATVLWMPSMLNAKLQSQLGSGFAGFNNPYAGAGQNFGGFDGNNRTSRANAYTMVQASTMDTIALTMSCGWTQTDFGRAQADRLLFPRVTMNDVPGTPQGQAAIVANAQYLHNWLWQENLPATDAELQRTVKLFNDVWNDRNTTSAQAVNCSLNASNDPNYTGRAWAAVIAYMVGDIKYVFR